VKRIRHSILLIALILLSACSNTFMYNQLDWLIPWYMDDYVDLDREQRRAFKAQLRDLLGWHRSEELASYILILDGIREDLQEPVTGSDVEGWANLGLAAYERIEERMLPMLFDLGRQLSDPQMEAFLQRLEQGQRELEEEYLERTDEEYTRDGQENLEDSLSDVLGRLTDEQEQVIAGAAASLQRFDFAWLEERRQWLETLATLLQREPGWEQAIMDALKDREKNRTDAYRSIYRHNAVIINDAIAAVLNLRTGKQDARLMDEIADYQRDLRKLIAQADTE
jgi:hypothetical protein